MGNRAIPVYQDANLPAYFGRDFSKVSCELRAYDIAVYFPPVDSLKRVKIA
jgi:hypothetical protein